MHDLGQPLHAFDADKVKLPMEVRWARPNELVVTLDGVKRKLTKEDLVVADANGPIDLCGVMGGEATEVTPETTEILLVAGTFDGTTVRKMAQRHGLRTEASARFERGLQVQLPELAMGEAVKLMEEVAGGSLQSLSDQMNAPPARHKLGLTMARLERVLGFGITHKEAAGALERLQIRVGESSKEQIVVPEVPWWRPDLKLPEDLAEEVVRVLGYERVPSTLPPWRPQRLVFDRERARRRLVRDVLYGAGLFEVATYSFVSEEQLTSLGYAVSGHAKLKNPLSSEQAYLRSSLLPSHLAVLSRNRHYADEIGFYEISAVFAHKGGGELPQEPLQLGLTLQRPEAALRHLKGILDSIGWALNVELDVLPHDDRVRLAPGRSGQISLGGRTAGWIGQVHPEHVQRLKLEGEVAYLEVNLGRLLEAASTRRFGGVSRYPVIVHDLSILVPRGVTWQAVKQAAAPEAVEYVGDYFGAGVMEGQRALTLRLTVARPDRTPTEEEAVQVETGLLARLERKLGAQLRR
jgi:phenylalanyl-tRNA synthetase beta chain